MSVVQISDENEKCIDNKHWNTVNAHGPGSSFCYYKLVKSICCSKYSSIRKEDLNTLTFSENRAHRIKVVSKTLVFLTRDIGQKIEREANDEPKSMSENSARRVVKDFGVDCDIGLTFGDVNFVVVERVCVSMVAAMAIFPSEVRGEKRRMEKEADCIIEPLVLAKGMVTTFMANDPKTSEDTSLTKPVKRPC